MGYTFHTTVNNNGDQQVLYKFSYQAKPIIIPTGVHVKKKLFSKLKGEPKSKLAKIESIILDSIAQAKSRVPPHTHSELKKIIQNRIEGHKVEDGQVRLRIRQVWEDRIEFFDRAKKYDSKRHNQDSMRVVMEVLSNMYVDEISSSHIRQLIFELMIGRSSSSVAGYLRDLRAAIISVVGKAKSPFIGVAIPKPQKKKNIALTWEEFQAFKNAPVKTPAQQLVLDMFVFRYYCLGMRIKDQILLKKSQIVNGRISYTTQKSKKHFDFQLPQECLDIIAKYPKGKYVFPVMRENLKGEELNDYIREVVRRMNKSLKRIAGYVGIDKDVTTHSSRHSFANINQDKGLLFLQKAFDHENSQTTQGYVESLSNQDELMSQVKR